MGQRSKRSRLATSTSRGGVIHLRYTHDFTMITYSKHTCTWTNIAQHHYAFPANNSVDGAELRALVNFKSGSFYNAAKSPRPATSWCRLPRNSFKPFKSTTTPPSSLLSAPQATWRNATNRVPTSSAQNHPGVLVCKVKKCRHSAHMTAATAAELNKTPVAADANEGTG